MRYFINIVANFGDDPTTFDWPAVLGAESVDKIEVSKDGRKPSSPNTPDALFREVKDLSAELDALMQSSNTKAVKNKEGIALHGRLERCKGDLDAMKKRGLDVSNVEPELLAVTKKLLKDIFGIDASQVQA